MSNNKYMNNNKYVTTSTTSGIGLGSAVAVVISYTKWHSILWAIIHGFFSWFYVIYFALTYGK